MYSKRPFILAQIGLYAIALVTALPVHAQEQNSSGAVEGGKHSIGFVASDNALAQDVGLPVYPGAKRYKGDGDDSDSVQLGAWVGSSDFRLAVLKLTSDDRMDKIAAYYRKALGKYGPVVDCTNAPRPSNETDNDDANDADGPIDCGNDRQEKGGILLKAGTKKNQHVVGLEPNGAHTIVNLVYVKVPKTK